MAYIYPKTGDNKVVYKGRRYWIIDLVGKDAIDGFGCEFCDLIMYDKRFGGIIATIKRNTGGSFTASLISHVELSYELKNLTEVVQWVPIYADAYDKACGG